MTEDAAIRIDFDSAEFVHINHTMEFFLRPIPRNLPHRILGTRPRRSELEFSNEARLPRYLPTDSPTHCLGYPCGWGAYVNTFNHCDWVAYVNTFNHCDWVASLTPSITRHLVATCPTGTPGYTLWISRLSPPT